jgi:hypothetical protein
MHRPLGDGEHRVERGERLLRHEGDVAADQRAPALRRHRHQIFAREGEPPARYREPGRQELRDRAPHHRLAGAGFADQAEDFSRRQREVEIADDRERFATDAGGDGERLGEERHLVRRFRSSHHFVARSFANFGIEGH